MHQLQQTIHDFLTGSNDQPESLIYSQTVENIHALCANVRLLERAGYDKEAISHLIKELTTVHERSPFIQHARQRPRGYPGDYEIIEYLLSDENRSKPNTLEYFCEEYILKGPISQQHRNKLKYQADLILDVISSRTEIEKRILSIACNSSWDLRSIQRLLLDANTVFYLNDRDTDALKYAETKLESLKPKCRFIPGNFIRAMKTLTRETPFQLIVTGGLCDYLTDRQIAYLINTAYHQLLDEGGKLYLTNIAKHNPLGPWMNYMADWQVIERDEQDIAQIVEQANCPLTSLKVQREACGLTLLIEISK